MPQLPFPVPNHAILTTAMKVIAFVPLLVLGSPCRLPEGS